MTLAEMKTKLASLEAAENEIKSYSITGSHSVTNSDSKDLVNQIALLRRRIYRFQGYTGRTFPEFN